MSRFVFSVLLLFLSSSVAHAQLFRIEKADNPNISEEDVRAFEREVNDNLPDVDASEYLDAVANAVAISGRGSNVDYVSGMTLFAFGGGIGVGGESDGGLSDITSGDKEDLKRIKGAGFSANLMVGMNMGLLGGTLGPVDLDRLNVYLSFFTFNKEVQDIDAKTTSFALYGQYKLMKGLPLPSKYLFSWTGLDLSVGISHTSFKGKYDYKINESLRRETTVAGVPREFTISYDGLAKTAVDTKTTSFTAEMSSGVNVLYALGLYAGLGLDLNSGDADATGNATGDITASNGVGAVGTGILDVGEDGKPDASFVRSFVGLQVNAWLLKIYGQVNIALAPSDLYGVNIGTRIVW